MATVKTNPGTEINVTVIGDSVRVQGNLSGDEDLHVLGRVDGRIELQRTLIVAPSGIVKAEVVVKNAVVSGVVVGNIHATESVEITREGRMVGDIYSPRVIIVDGASFRGSVDMGEFENMPVRKPAAERPKPASAPVTSSRISSPPRPASPPMPPRATTQPPRPATPPPAAPVVQAPVVQPAVAAPMSEPLADPAPDSDDVEELEEDMSDEDVGAGLSTDPPAARGLPNKHQKARVIVKRR